MTETTKMWDDITRKIRKLIEGNKYTHYTKQTCNDMGEITSVGFYANTEAEMKAYENCFGVTIEETRLVASLTEKQRKLILLQSQKEKIEKEIAGLLN